MPLASLKLNDMNMHGSNEHIANEHYPKNMVSELLTILEQWCLPGLSLGYQHIEKISFQTYKDGSIDQQSCRGHQLDKTQVSLSKEKKNFISPNVTIGYFHLQSYMPLFTAR